MGQQNFVWTISVGDKLKSEADAALQAQLQRQQVLVASAAEAAAASKTRVRTAADAGSDACRSGAATPHSLHRLARCNSHLCIWQCAQALSSNFTDCCTAAEALGAGHQSWDSAVRGSLQAAAKSFTAVSAIAGEADQLGAGDTPLPECTLPPAPLCSLVCFDSRGRLPADSCSRLAAHSSASKAHIVFLSPGLVAQHGSSRAAFSEGVVTFVMTKYRNGIPTGRLLHCCDYTVAAT